MMAGWLYAVYSRASQPVSYAFMMILSVTIPIAMLITLLVTEPIDSLKSYTVPNVKSF